MQINSYASINETLNKLCLSLMTTYKSGIVNISTKFMENIESSISETLLGKSIVSNDALNSLNEMCTTLYDQINESLVKWSSTSNDAFSKSLKSCLTPLSFENETCFIDYDSYNYVYQTISSDKEVASASSPNSSPTHSSKKMSISEYILFIIAILEFIMNGISFCQDQNDDQYLKSIAESLSQICSLFEQDQDDRFEESKPDLEETQPRPSNGADIPDVI